MKVVCNGVGKVGLNSWVENFKDELGSKEFEPMSAADEMALCIAYKNGDQKAKDSLIKSNLRYVVKMAEKYKEKPDICNAIGAHHDEVEMTSLLAPIVQVCDAISGARPGARREIVEAYIKRLNDLENIAMSYPGVTKTYAIQAGRELRVIVGADKVDDATTEALSAEIAKKIQDEMTYPGQVKITVIREVRSVAVAK